MPLNMITPLGSRGVWATDPARPPHWQCPTVRIQLSLFALLARRGMPCVLPILYTVRGAPVGLPIADDLQLPSPWLSPSCEAPGAGARVLTWPAL